MKEAYLIITLFLPPPMGGVWTSWMPTLEAHCQDQSVAIRATIAQLRAHLEREHPRPLMGVPHVECRIDWPSSGWLREIKEAQGPMVARAQRQDLVDREILREAPAVLQQIERAMRAAEGKH